MKETEIYAQIDKNKDKIKELFNLSNNELTSIRNAINCYIDLNKDKFRPECIKELEFIGSKVLMAWSEK